MEIGIGRTRRDVSVAQPDRAGEVAADDEAALIAAAQADPLAFGALYRRYLPRVYRYVRAHSAGDDDAADLAQQVFLRALDALPAYRPRGAPFAAWLFRIARNAAVDAARSRHPTVDWQALPEALHPADERGPEAELLRHEDLRRLAGLLRTLDPAKRELLALRFAAGLSATEIAEVVGKRPEAVKKQITRTLQALKEQYRDA
jgi:RNA polymerase sigma-70 factor (ECF subfamily)